MKQRTISSEVSIKGVGLHTGRKCRAVFKPALENTGVVFVRTDCPGRPRFSARLENVVDVVRGTTLGEGDQKVYTIEHVLATVQGLGIDNLLIELDENEPPVGDGSAKVFVDILKTAGIKEQGAERVVFTVQQPFEYQSNLTLIRIEPSETFEIDCQIDYDHPLIKKQEYIFKLNSHNFESEIGPARTFCFDYEIETLKKMGLAKGGSLDNAIVIGPTGIYNSDTALRFENELVRHKILDLMGDLMLVGGQLQARIVARRCGHGHNIKFLKELTAKGLLIKPTPVLQGQ